MQIFVHRDNQQLGPFDEAEIKTQLAAGALLLRDNVWWEGQTGWVPLAQTPFAGPGRPAGTPSPLHLQPPTTSPAPQIAIWSLILGCLGFFLSIFSGIPAVILGHMSLSKIGRNPGMGGHGIALTGLILGYISIVFLPLISIVAISVLIALGNQVKTAENVSLPLTNSSPASPTNP
jgi:hypothetical protein